jgi:arginine repressor
MTRQELLQEIRNILKKEPEKMYSREEILNLLGEKGNDAAIESLLAELEVSSSLKESGSDVYATCRGGTVYYKWNR